MSRAALNFLVDFVLLVVLAVWFGISVTLQVVFPPATQAAGWTLWGFSYDDWSFVQFITLCVYTALVLLHLILHWKWVCSFVATRWAKAFGTRPALTGNVETVYGVGTLILVLTFVSVFVAAAEFSIDEGAPAAGIPTSVAPP